jgi:3'-phosphoadenosine 5'-phosphosulfate (PAPS) 3'-phosphatase
LNTSTASIIRAAATQHWAGKARSLLNEGWLKRALGAARKRDRSTQTLADLRLTAIITETLDPEVLSILSNAGFHQAWYDPNTKTVTSSRVYASHNSLMLRKKSSLD